MKPSEVKHLEKETSKDRGGHNQEDTRPEPRGGGLTGVWVAGRELLGLRVKYVPAECYNTL